MIGEIGLGKDPARDPLSYIVSDVNDAIRRMNLARSLIVIGHALKEASAANTISDVYELPGRNYFLMHIMAASGTPTGFTVKIQGSLTGSSIATHWNDVTSHSNIGFHSANDNTPYRFYRLIISNATSNGSSIDVHFSAIGY